jgi:CO/xanthine dehydrogenase FAD-binding subunit
MVFLMDSVALKYQRPTTVRAALDLLSQGFVPIAGGTDYYPGKVGQPIVDKLLDLSGVTDFDLTRSSSMAVSVAATGMYLSALTTWRDCQTKFAAGKWPVWLAALAESAKDIGGWQVQNRGTLGGNLCNASPAADGVVALLALGAKVVLVSKSSAKADATLKTRTLSITDFVLGNRLTARNNDELLSQIYLPEHSERARSTFIKLGHRKYLVISIVMVAVFMDFDESGQVTTCRIAIGSCAKAALRVHKLESLILAKHRDEVISVVRAYAAEIVAAIHPIDDVRGTAVYRQSASQELVLRAFTAVLQ